MEHLARSRAQLQFTQSKLLGTKLSALSLSKLLCALEMVEETDVGEQEMVEKCERQKDCEIL